MDVIDYILIGIGVSVLLLILGPPYNYVGALTGLLLIGVSLFGRYAPV